MRAAFVHIGDAEDPLEWSGTPYHMLRALRASGAHIEVISPLRRDFRFLFSLHKLRNRNFQIDRETVALRSYESQVMSALRKLDVDVIVSPSSVPICRLTCPQPILYWTDAIYDSMPSYYPGFDSETANARNAKAQERSALERVAFAVFSSDWAANETKKYYPEFAAKVRMIPYGANLLGDPVSPPRVSKEECTLLFSGVDWNRKGGFIALEAARLLNERGLPTRLKIVGCAPPGGSLPPYVEVLGFISKRETAGREQYERLFATSSFLVLPTRAEAAGIVFCEASAYGLPAIASNTGGVSTYVRDGVNGRLLPLTAEPSAYASVIEGLFLDPAGGYLSMCHAARNEYECRLNWATSVRSLLSLCEIAVQAH